MHWLEVSTGGHLPVLALTQLEMTAIKQRGRSLEFTPGDLW